MNKKQAGIIVTLLALIVCAGILAAKVNGPLDVSSNLSNDGIFTLKNSANKSTSNSTDYFVTSKMERETSDNMVIANYKALIDDKNTSAAQKSEAEKKYISKTTEVDLENRVELNLKGKGFEDVICFIEDNKARVIVKAKELTTQQRKQIQDVVKSVAKLDVEIETKQ